MAFQDISMNDYLFIGQDEEVDKKKTGLKTKTKEIQRDGIELRSHVCVCVENEVTDGPYNWTERTTAVDHRENTKKC